MSNRTYVCCSCRTARRATAAYGLKTALRCSKCRGPLWELDRRWRIPKKHDVDAWADLEMNVLRDEARWSRSLRIIGERKAADLDRKLTAAQNSKDSKRKVTTLSRLTRERKKVSQQYGVP